MTVVHESINIALLRHINEEIFVAYIYACEELLHCIGKSGEMKLNWA